MPILPLDGSWSLMPLAGQAPEWLRGRVIPATVPGCVHLDLLAAGVIDDPFDGDNEAAQQWIGSTDWRYRRTFDLSAEQLAAHERHDLVAQGLDTLATVELNGRVVATTENQHRSYRWSIAHLLREGENEIVVTFDAPVPAVERREREHGGKRFHVNHHPYNTLRKMASSFGWDWGIDAASSGIWRPLTIESWSEVRLASVRPLVEVVGGAGLLRAHVELAHQGRPTHHEVTVRLTREGDSEGESWSGSSTITDSGTVEVLVPQVDLWWPRGYGQAARYDMTLTVAPTHRPTRDSTDTSPATPDPTLTWRHRVGFRTISLDTTPDQHGTPFLLRVNGREVQVRGANWIPEDAFVTRIDTARLERRVKDATDAHMNLLRVWGGGLYESDDFYEICSRNGVLVWQDFLLACAAYSEEPWLAHEIEAEAREAVTRLSKHASLALWCGSNENLMGFADWDGFRSDARTWGAGYYFETFPTILAELDPTRPYIPGSPFSASPVLDPNLQTDATVHIWDVWNEKDYTHYRTWQPRFVAEFGFQGPPAWTTLMDTVHDTPAHPFSHQMLVHQKAQDGNNKLERGYTPHLPAPRTLDDWHFTTQLNQAHALRFGISWFRSLTPYNTGTIVWQLNDDWPVVSWAAVDYAERRKPLWYALRDAYSPRLATFQPDPDAPQGPLTLVVLNDTDTRIDGVAHLRRLALDGQVLAEAELPLAVETRSHTRLPLPPALLAISDASREILTAQATHDGAPVPGLARAIHDPAEVIEQALDPHALEAHAEPTPEGATLTLTARTYVRDIVVLADRADPHAHVDHSMISLLPGESRTLTLTAGHPIPTEHALAPTVLRSANQLHGQPIGTPLPTQNTTPTG